MARFYCYGLLGAESAHYMGTSDHVARTIAANGIRLVLDEQRTADVAASLRYVAAWNSAFLPSKDLSEGISAMFGKRKPEFTGE